jgi:hypothetical protein
MKWGAERRYLRLPGRYNRPFSRHALWLAEDHVLSVQSNRLSEDYRRYYYRDIQAFVMQRASGISPWVFGAGALTAAFLLPGLFFDYQNPFLWTCGGIFLAVTLYLIASGPACACYIQTAVSRDRLRSLHSIRVAEKALAIIQERVEQLQGPLRVEMASLPPALPSASSGAPAPPPLPTLRAPDSGWLHAAFFSLLLVEAATALLTARGATTLIHVASAVLLIAQIGCIVAILVRHRRFEIDRKFKALVIASLVVTAGLSYAAVMLNAFDKSRRQDFTPVSGFVENYPGAVPLRLTSAAADGIIAVLGFVMLAARRRPVRRAPPLIAPE